MWNVLGNKQSDFHSIYWISVSTVKSICRTRWSLSFLLALRAYSSTTPKSSKADPAADQKQKPRCSHHLQLEKVLVTQLCLTLRDPMDCSPPHSSVHGILQARRLKWVAIPFSRGSSWPRDWTWVSHIAGTFFTVSHQGSPSWERLATKLRCTVERLTERSLESELDWNSWPVTSY